MRWYILANYNLLARDLMNNPYETNEDSSRPVQTATMNDPSMP